MVRPPIGGHFFKIISDRLHILYGVLLAIKDTPGGLLAEIKKQRYAETRKAKLRLSNIKLEEIVQVFRGSSKHIKH